LGIAQLTTKITTVPEVLTRYRFHDKNDGSALLPTHKTIAQELEHFETVFHLLREFLKDSYGDELIASTRQEDSLFYWEHLLALSIFESKSSHSICDYSRKTLLSQLPEGRRKYIWRAILCLPTPLGKRTFQTWWGMFAWKNSLRPFWKFFKMTTPNGVRK
jgi:hypothetical protein